MLFNQQTKIHMTKNKKNSFLDLIEFQKNAEFIHIQRNSEKKLR